MKPRLILLALLLMDTGAFAQLATDETAIQAVRVKSTKDAYALHQAEFDAAFADAATVFRATNNRSGYEAFSSDAQLTSVFGTKPRDTNPRLENVTFKFYGPNAAFVTYDQHLYDKPSKEVRMMEKQNGQWKIGSSVSLWDFNQNKFEEDAVRKLIDTETRAYHEAKGDLLKAQWYDKAYVERLQENLQGALGAPYAKGDKLKSFSDMYLKTLRPSGHTVRLSDYDSHISGATAWATFTQEELDGTGKVVSKQREVRILERESGSWKMVFMGLLPMQ